MTWWQGVIAVVVALIGGGGVAWALVRSTRRKLDAEARLADAEAMSAEAEAEGTVFDQLRRLRTDFSDLAERADQCHDENNAMRKRLATIESVLPFALLSERLKDYETLKVLLNRLDEPIVLTSPANAGTILFANDRFCEVMGYSLERVLELQFPGLVHPDDRRATKAAETVAWTATVYEFVNRLITATGAVVWLRWIAPPYLHGVTIALAEVQSLSEMTVTPIGPRLHSKTAAAK